MSQVDTFQHRAFTFRINGSQWRERGNKRQERRQSGAQRRPGQQLQLRGLRGAGPGRRVQAPGRESRQQTSRHGPGRRGGPVILPQLTAAWTVINLEYNYNHNWLNYPKLDGIYLLRPSSCVLTHLRLIRRLTPHKLLSPNTLSVEISADEDVTSPGGPRVHSPLSPIRGISYPPLSPKSLKRGFAIQQLGPGPVTKSRHSPGASVSSELSPSPSHQPPNITVIPEPQGQDQDTLPDPEQRMKGRGGRFDRPVDSRRYHTAGTIEDLKVLETLYLWPSSGARSERV